MTGPAELPSRRIIRLSDCFHEKATDIRDFILSGTGGNSISIKDDSCAGNDFFAPILIGEVFLSSIFQSDLLPQVGSDENKCLVCPTSY